MSEVFTRIRVSMSFRTGLACSFNVKWKLRTRPCAKNISYHPLLLPPPYPRHPPHRETRGLTPQATLRGIAVILLNTYRMHRPMYASKDRGSRAMVMALAILLTWPINQVASAGDDAPTRMRETPRLQVSKDMFFRGGIVEIYRRRIAPDSRRAEGAPMQRRLLTGSDMTGDVKKRARSGDVGGV
jgi:hypothetical protein